MTNESILETLKVLPLSEDEKKSRHILKRLIGPIASCKEGTRNGRKYNKALWEKEREFFLMAFIQKHRLFGAYNGKDDGKKLSKEELVKLYMLMDGLSDSQPLKQLEEKE